MENMNHTDGPSSMRKAIPLLIAGACVLFSGCFSGCRGSQTIWSAKAQSPDGKVMATARAIGRSGFGINSVQLVGAFRLGNPNTPNRRLRPKQPTEC
jgi:hypothetical protein